MRGKIKKDVEEISKLRKENKKIKIEFVWKFPI